jgi:hypothetical protein
METGTIPPNLNYKVPKRGIPALTEGRMKVVTEPTPLEGEYVGVNSFGFGGANVHMILKSNPKSKVNNGAPTDHLPRLVAISGRTEEAVSTVINDVSPIYSLPLTLLSTISLECASITFIVKFIILNLTICLLAHLAHLKEHFTRSLLQKYFFNIL